MTPEKVAYQNGQSVESWREAHDILGPMWEGAWETVAHLAALGDMGPGRVALILVGGQGYPGVVGRF